MRHGHISPLVYFWESPSVPICSWFTVLAGSQQIRSGGCGGGAVRGRTLTAMGVEVTTDNPALERTHLLNKY